MGARVIRPASISAGLLLILCRPQQLGRRAAAALARLSPTTVAAIERSQDCPTAAVDRLAEALGARLTLGPVGVSPTFWDGAATSTIYYGWTTLLGLLEALYAVVGGAFDLVPRSQSVAARAPPVRAKSQVYGKGQRALTAVAGADGIRQSPYGRGLGAWMVKAREENCRAVQGSSLRSCQRGRTPAGGTAASAGGRYLVAAWAVGVRGRAIPAPFPSAIVAWGATEQQRADIGAAFRDAWYVGAKLHYGNA